MRKTYWKVEGDGDKNMKILAKYTVIEEDDGSIRTYNSFKINAPVPISSAIANYFTRLSKEKPDICKGSPDICDCERCLKLKGEF